MGHSALPHLAYHACPIIYGPTDPLRVAASVFGQQDAQAIREALTPRALRRKGARRRASASTLRKARVVLPLRQADVLFGAARRMARRRAVPPRATVPTRIEIQSVGRHATPGLADGLLDVLSGVTILPLEAPRR